MGLLGIRNSFTEISDHTSSKQSVSEVRGGLNRTVDKVQIGDDLVWLRALVVAVNTTPP